MESTEKGSLAQDVMICKRLSSPDRVTWLKASSSEVNRGKGPNIRQLSHNIGGLHAEDRDQKKRRRSKKYGSKRRQKAL